MQLELSLQAPTPADLAEVAGLASWLYAAGDRWVPAREIAAELHLNERKIRHLAASSGGLIVSGPGCPGYKHSRHCDPEEIAAVQSRLLHQARLMADRASEIAREFHRAAAR